MTNRIAETSKTRKTLLAAAIAASALTALTACGSSKPTASAVTTATASAPAVGAPSNDSAQSPSAPNSSPTNQSTQAPANAPTTPSTNVKPTTSAKPTAPKTTAPASTLPADCTTTQLKATVSPLTRPINHVLLTVTNTGKAACNLYYFPALRLDADQQSVTQAVEASKPQAVVTIAPGESAYAGIGTSAADGSGGAGKVEKQVDVFLESRDQSGSLPGRLTLPLPANTYVDDKAFVTYWQSDLQDAVAW